MTQDAAIAEFPAGAARGVKEDGLCIWKGLPYALKPSGERRWRPPVAAPRWDGVRDATRAGPACPQSFRRPDSVYECDIPNKDEDCLNLNVWAPEGAKGLPVLVWIHGGNLLRGAGSEPLCDGAALAKRGQVVVTINYRLGVLGYLAHPELSAESPQGVSGNYGLMDQILALEWVRLNIAAAGGDPANVTVAGESAGALSVYYLLCAPAAKGLFARAIAQSGHICSAQPLKEERHGMGTGERAGEALLAALGATSIAELRVWDAQELAVRAVAEGGFAAQGVVDGVILPDQPLALFESGRCAQTPLLTGFNSGEIPTLEFLMPPIPATAAEYEAEIRNRYGDLAEAFLARYPPDDMKASAEAAVGDAFFGWTALRAAKAYADLGQPAYVYHFDHGCPEAEARGLRGFHACELTYLFDTMEQSPPNWPKAPATSVETALTRAIGDYWTGFVRDGVPAARNAPVWPDFSKDEAVMHFEDAPRVSHGHFSGMFALADEAYARLRAAGNLMWNWNVSVAAPVIPPRG